MFILYLWLNRLQTIHVIILLIKVFPIINFIFIVVIVLITNKHLKFLIIWVEFLIIFGLIQSLFINLKMEETEETFKLDTVQPFELKYDTLNVTAIIE